MGISKNWRVFKTSRIYVFWELKHTFVTVNLSLDYWEMDPLNRTMAICGIEHCKALFPWHGIAETVVAGNEPHYASWKSAQFAESAESEHMHI